MTSFYGGGAASTSGGGGSSVEGALIFKGTLGISDDGATVLVLPDTHEEGWTYLVVTAGTYAGQLCEKGDFVICVSSGESASDLDWTVVQGNTFNTLPTPTALDEGKIISVDTSGNYVLIDNPSSGETENLPDPSEADEGKILSVGADGNYILTDNPAKDKLDKANPTYTGSLTGENAAFSGTVTVATPAAEGEAANKGYVDAAKMELEGDINTLQQTVANQAETINTLNQQVTNITSGTEELPYLKNTGDSGTGVYDFTGATINAAEPVDNSNVATKRYVDQKVANAGGTGEVVSYTQGDGISISPENEISLSIDSAGANGLKVGTNGLGLDLATATTSGAMAASDKIAIASNTTEITNIKDGTTELPYLKETNPTYEGTLIGGDATFTGSVQISTPDQDNEAANKSYVDAIHVQAVADAKNYTDSEITNLENGTTELPYIKNNGDTVTGGYDLTEAAVTIAEPASDNSPATKKYVDESIEAIDVSAQIAPLTERVTAAESDIDGLQTEISPIKDKLTIANHAVFIGDSTSQGYDNDDYSFVDIFEKNGDFSGITKLAVGGATLGPYQIVSEASGYSCLEQIQANESAISDADFCFLQFCANDVKCLVSKNVQIGTPSDTSTTTTVCGYLKKCIELLYACNPTISIVFINLATNESVIDMMWDDEVDSDADKYKFYHKVWNLSIAEVLEQYNIPMINIFDWTGINANNFSNYTVHTADGTHLNTAGNTLTYYRIKNALWNESEKSYPTQPKNLIIDAILGGNIGIENVERIKNAFDNNIQVFFNLKEREDNTEDLIVPVSFSSDVGYGSYFTLSKNNKLYLYDLWINTSGQITNASYNITDMKSNIDTALAAGAKKLEILESYSDETYTIDSMKPNTLYDLRKVDLPTITVAAFEQPANTNYVWTYHMIFQSNITPVVLTLPSSVIYPENFEIETKHIYEINIIDNLLSYQSWPME